MYQSKREYSVPWFGGWNTFSDSMLHMGAQWPGVHDSGGRGTEFESDVSLSITVSI